MSDSDFPTPDFKALDITPYKWNRPMDAAVWELCPKCNGEGSVLTHWDGDGPYNTSCTCDLCNGKKIISKITGLPPQ